MELWVRICPRGSALDRCLEFENIGGHFQASGRCDRERHQPTTRKTAAQVLRVLGE